MTVEAQHDALQGHLMRFANLLNEMASRNLEQATNLCAVRHVVNHINDTLESLTQLETERGNYGVHVHG